MPYVVRVTNIAELKEKWDRVIASHRGQVPSARFVQTQSDFQQLAQRLARYPRISWFYYSDNADGIALRLYDREFRTSCPQQYREAPKEDGEEWVVIRGHALGSPRDPCKQGLVDAFGENRWSIREAPTNNPNSPSESIKLGTPPNDRIAYFEHPYLNDSSGAIMRPVPNLPVIPAIQQDALAAATEAIQQFRQIILYGPPGTGKTRLARRVALKLLEPQATDLANFIEAQISFRLSALTAQQTFDLVVFHPAYEYEQFVGGIVPRAVNGGLSYEIEPGIFLKMARWAEENNRSAVLIIDEINRGNLPKLLGELLYALEYREAKVRLPFEWEGRSDLTVPKGLFIVGTMNSSDRSIGHIDVAVRRRFGLIHIEPDAETIRTFWRNSDPILGDQLAGLMNGINSDLDQYDRKGELRVGHAYFLGDLSLPNPRKQVERKWFHQVQQLL